MAAIQVNDVVVRVGQLLQDTTHIRWPLTEKLQYITDAVREVCFYKPDACVKTSVTNLVAGTKQAIPAEGTTLIDIVRNMGVGGATPGAAPRAVTRDILDAQMPGWHASTPAAEVKHYVFDPQNQRVFYVYPPQPATGQGSLELVYSAEPANATENGTLDLDGTWLPAIVNYALYRCYSKDAEYAANANLAAAYYQAFNAQMVGRTNAEMASDVNRNSAGTNPNVRAAGA
jgi:hypothetical protein